jgi:hypothetical protein
MWAIVQVVGLVGWVAIFFVSPVDKRSTILGLVAMLFAFSFVGFGIIAVLFRRFPPSIKPK